MIGLISFTLLTIGSPVFATGGKPAQFFSQYLKSPDYISQCEARLLPVDQFTFLLNSMKAIYGANVPSARSDEILESILDGTCEGVPVDVGSEDGMLDVEHAVDLPVITGIEEEKQQQLVVTGAVDNVVIAGNDGYELVDGVDMGEIEMHQMGSFHQDHIPVDDFITYAGTGSLKSIQAAISAVWGMNPIPSSPTFYENLDESVNIQLYSLLMSVQNLSQCTDLVCRVWREALAQFHYRVAIQFAKRECHEFSQLAIDIEEPLRVLINKAESQLAGRGVADFVFIPALVIGLAPVVAKGCCCMLNCLARYIIRHRDDEATTREPSDASPVEVAQDPFAALRAAQLRQLAHSYRTDVFAFRNKLDEIVPVSDEAIAVAIAGMRTPLLNKLMEMTNQFLVYGKEIVADALKASVFCKSEKLSNTLNTESLFTVANWTKSKAKIRADIDALTLAIAELV